MGTQLVSGQPVYYRTICKIHALQRKTETHLTVKTERSTEKRTSNAGLSFHASESVQL